MLIVTKWKLSVQVGDLIRESAFPDDSSGLIVEVKDRRLRVPYAVLCSNGKIEWFPKKYIEGKCEIISASR